MAIVAATRVTSVETKGTVSSVSNTITTSVEALTRGEATRKTSVEALGDIGVCYGLSSIVIYRDGSSVDHAAIVVGLGTGNQVNLVVLNDSGADQIDHVADVDFSKVAKDNTWRTAWTKAGPDNSARWLLTDQKASTT